MRLYVLEKLKLIDNVYKNNKQRKYKSGLELIKRAVRN